MLKGLLFGRNPINMTTGNGKTLATFFALFSPENLHQIYVSELPIDSEICGTYYKINETQVIKNLIKNGNSPYIRIKEKKAEEGSVENLQTHSSFKRILTKIFRTKFGIVLRNKAWRKVKSVIIAEIAELIQNIKPDFLFYDVGNLCAEYELIENLVKEHKIPLILYVSDDYVFNESKKNSRWNKRMRSHFLSMSKFASLIILISDAMKEKYQQYLNNEIIVAMNGCRDISFKYIMMKENPTIVYTGNVGIGRLDVLKKINHAISTAEEFLAKMEIYSSFALSKKDSEELERQGHCKFCGAVYGDELVKAWERADILVHVESFDKKYRNILSTAISTKIAEYMCSGRPILIVAPEYSESARFIKRLNAGMVIHSNIEKDIQRGILDIISNPYITEKRARISQEYALKNLTRSAVSKRIYEKIESYCVKKI